MGLQEESSKKDVWSMGLVGKHSIMSKPSPILKFKRCLDFSDIYRVWLPLGAETETSKRDILLDLMGLS